MKYFFGFLAVVALVVLVFILVLRGFGGSGPKVESQLTDYAATQTVVRMTVEGPVKADQDHRVVVVTVGRDTNTMEVIQGYEGTVLQTKDYPNNETAYATFLRALQLQGYTKGNPDASTDSRGVCPADKIYTFEIITGSASVQRFWKSACGDGSFKGNAAAIRQLFRAQIPEYSKLARGTGL